MAVLVAYATCHGSTRGVAERIASRLALSGAEPDVRTVQDVHDVSVYEAVVLGSPIHGGKWLPEATEFLSRHGPELSSRMLWLFSVSTVGDEEAMFPPRVARRMRNMRREPPELLEFRQVLNTIEHRNFAGAVASSDWPGTGRLFFKTMGGRYGDHRNWNAIDAWGDVICSQLVATAHQQAAPELPSQKPSQPVRRNPEEIGSGDRTQIARAR